MVYGKLVAGAIGFLVLGPFGLLLGLAIGHAFDRGLKATFALGSPEQVQKIQALFFECCFSLLGQIAKADGRVSEAEIEHTEQIMTQLGVAGHHRGQAIAYFKAGAADDFQSNPLIAQFIEISRGHTRVHETLLVFLISMAQADGVIDEAERQVLQDCAAQLGFNTAAFHRLLQMAQAQQHFHQQTPGGNTASMLSDAYTALGLSSDCSDGELKRGYRKLMSQHHPDKLIAQGVPEDMVRLGTEKSQDIQAAYETIKNSRKR
jgi:DnaJ like chaperone protein